MTSSRISRQISLSTLLLALLLAGASTAFAEGKQVSFKSGDETINALLYEPSSQTPAGDHSAANKKMDERKRPALLLIHEWWGLNDWVKQQAEEWAGRGYVVLAVDLYRGKVAATPDEAHELMRGLPDDRSLRDMKAGYDFLASQKDVDPKRVGAMGWCMGGGKAEQLAQNEPALRAVVINYGAVPADKESVEKIHAAVLGLFGGQDRGITPESAKKFEQQLKALHRDAEVVIYPDAGHAFENANNKQGYRADDAADALKRQQEFFAKHLKP